MFGVRMGVLGASFPPPHKQVGTEFNRTTRNRNAQQASDRFHNFRISNSLCRNVYRPTISAQYNRHTHIHTHKYTNETSKHGRTKRKRQWQRRNPQDWHRHGQDGTCPNAQGRSDCELSSCGADSLRLIAFRTLFVRQSMCLYRVVRNCRNIATTCPMTWLQQQSAHTHRERETERQRFLYREGPSELSCQPPCLSTVGGVVLEEEEKGNNPTQHNPIQRYRQEEMETSNHHSTLYQEDTFAAVVFVAVGKIVSSWFPRGFCRLTTIGREKQEASLFKLLL